MQLKKDAKTISFIASSEHVFNVREHPKPASSMIPQWWKDMRPYAGKDHLELNPAPNYTAKKCFPLLDGLTAGYIVTLWADVHVSIENNNLNLKWTTKEAPFEAWNIEQSKGYDIPEGFSQTVVKYSHGWRIRTPEGYSCLITHPFGYQNLPIKTITGIVDTDVYEAEINCPFVIRNDFQGIIERGTPMFQVIPFKRDMWESSISSQTEKESFFQKERLYTRIVSSYGRWIRKNKEYR
jgi:hypothetical protein